MKTNKLVIQTNAKGSQIESNETHYKLKGIPITTNSGVMNGVYYPKEENEKGMPTMIGKPFTIDHPVDKNGNFVSALEGNGLMDFFSGGVVTNVYEVNDTWYADAEIKKSLLAAQTNGDKLQSKLDSKEDLGVSTGLYFSSNELSGVNSKGQKYSRSAINQEFNHLAAVDNPAGGKETTAVFNSENTFVCNFNDITNDEQQEPLNESAFNKLVEKLKGVFAPATDKGYNSQEFDVNQQNEDLIMDRSEMLKALGLTANSQVTDDELKTLMKSKLAANASEGFTKEDVESIVNAAVKPLADQLTANADKELNEVAEQVAALNKGLDADDAKALGLEKAKAFLAANGAEHVAAGYNAQHGGRTTASNKKDDGFDNIDLNAGLEG
jgi:hypothetical protein